MTTAAMLAKEMKLVHIGGGYYSDSTGEKTYRSHDGVKIQPLSKTELNKTIHTKAKIHTQENPVLANPLGEPSGKKDKPTKMKKKSLVEFVERYDIEIPEWIVRYQLMGTLKKIHTIFIPAISQREAYIKAKSLLTNSHIIGMPQINVKIK